MESVSKDITKIIEINTNSDEPDLDSGSYEYSASIDFSMDK